MLKRDNIPKSIDFLQPVHRSNDVWANAYMWMFQVGKYLLIVVQLITLGVFASRFVLDRRNNDLTKDINDKVAILSGGNWQQDSVTYENMQSLLGDVQRISNGQKINSTIINEVRDGIPYGLNVESFAFNDGRVSITLKTTDFQAFKDYETAIKNNPRYTNVSFSTTKDSSIFDIRVNFIVDGRDG